MKVIFFGNSSAVPAAGNGYTSFLVSLGGRLVLVDTGDNPVRSLREAGLDPLLLDAVLLTHSHVDHLGGFPSLVSALDCMGRAKELVVAAGEHAAEKAKRLLEVFDIEGDKLTFPFRYTSGYEADGSSVSLLPGRHSVPTSMGLFREGRTALLYTSDIRHDPAASLPRGDYAALIHEATYPHEALPDPTGHSSALQAGLAAAEAGARSLFLCHIYKDSYPAGLNPEDEARRVFDGEIIEPKLLTWYTIGNAERND